MIYNQLLPYLILSGALFSVGLFGILMRRSLIGILISAELILNAANVNFLAFSRFMDMDKAIGQIYSIFVIALAAGEVMVGLSIILCVLGRRNRQNLTSLSHFFALDSLSPTDS